MNKFLIIIIFFLLTLFQTSFLIHFQINGIVPNIVLISVVLSNFFLYNEDNKDIVFKDKGNLVLWLGFWAGLFLDFFYGLFFGMMMIIFIIISIGIKKGLCLLNRINALSFSLFLFLSIVFYNVGFLLFGVILNSPYLHLFQINLFLIQISYNLILALPLFYLIKFIKNRKIFQNRKIVSMTH